MPVTDTSKKVKNVIKRRQEEGKWICSVPYGYVITNSKTGAVWVVILDTGTHEPVLCEKFLKVPSGFGTKNYWGRIFYNLLYDIRSYAYYRWESLIKPMEGITAG